MNMKIRYKIGIFTFLFLIIVLTIVYLFNFMFTSNKNEVVVIDEIDKYGYKLDERDTDLFKNEFNNLKNILSKEDIEYESYAKSISTLFIIDFYNLENKNNKLDVGGVDFILNEYKDSFSLKSSDTIYKYVGSLKEEPEVTKVKIDSIEENTYELNEESYNSYVVKISWEYKKEYDYDKEGIITIINKEDKLSIVNYEGGLYE